MAGDTPARRRFLLVYNAAAGTANRAMLETVVARLRGYGAQLSALQCDRPEDVRLRIRAALDAAEFDAVLAAGGDGTIRLVAAALDGNDIPIGIVPLGTGNVLANEIGLRPRAGAIARMLIEGPAIPVQGATANGEPFLLMCGIGFDGRVISALDLGLKTRLGRAAYGRPVLNALTRPLEALEIEADGAMHYASWAIVTNAGRYGGPFLLTRQTHISVPGLQLVLFKGESRLTLLRQLAMLALGRLDALAAKRADVAIVPCMRVVVRANQPAPVQIDGDPFGVTPVRIGTDEGPRVRLIVPRPRATS